MNNPKVEILILNWNGGNLLYDCITSVLNSDYDNFNVTIIDNGSDDDSINKIKNNFTNINYILIDTNLGYAKGYNYGFKRLIDSNNTDYFLLLNNDTIILKSTIKNLISGTYVFGFNNIYGPKILNEFNKEVWYGGGKINQLTKLATHVGVNKYFHTTELKTMKTDFVSGCTMLIPKKIIDKLSGFNEIYDFYYEDVDLCLRAKSYDCSCFFISDSTVIHKISSSLGGRYSPLKFLYKFKSSFKYLYYNYNPILFFNAKR